MIDKIKEFFGFGEEIADEVTDDYADFEETEEAPQRRIRRAGAQGERQQVCALFRSAEGI